MKRKQRNEKGGNMNKKTTLAVILMAVLCATAFAQKAEDYLKSGQTAFEKKDFDKAIADQTQAIKINPNYTDAYIKRSSAYMMKRDFDKAKADLNTVLKIEPNNESAKNLFGVIELLSSY